MKVYILMINGQMTKQAFSTIEAANKKIVEIEAETYTHTSTDYVWDEDMQEEIAEDVTFTIPVNQCSIEEMELDEA